VAEGEMGPGGGLRKDIALIEKDLEVDFTFTLNFGWGMLKGPRTIVYASSAGPELRGLVRLYSDGCWLCSEEIKISTILQIIPPYENI
jgi:hypothetical protein